jgi:hypothetical protein
VELLSNRVLAPFLSKIDGGIDGEAWELKVCQWRKRDEHLLFFISLNHWGRRRDVGGGRKKL